MAVISDIHVVAPKGAHQHITIFLHGRDDDTTQFPESVLESETSAPTSKTRESLRFKHTLVQWFDIWSVENHSEQEEIQKEGLRESISAIVETIHQEARLVPLSHIFLGGISQGSATAILALLCCGETKLGGFVGLCTWMSFRDSIIDIAHRYEHDQSSPQRTSKSSHVAEKIRSLPGVVGQTSMEDDTDANVDAPATPIINPFTK